MKAAGYDYRIVFNLDMMVVYRSIDMRVHAGISLMW